MSGYVGIFLKVSCAKLSNLMVPIRWSHSAYWPPYFSDLTAPECFLWEHLKEKVYVKLPRTISKQKQYSQ